MTTPAIPLTVTQLENTLLELSAEMGIPVDRARMLLGTLVVSQLLPLGTFVKGGMGMKLLLGELGTRATSDLDVSNVERGPRWGEDFSKLLNQGWGHVPASKGARKRDPLAPNRVAFRGTLRAKNPHDPGLAIPHYVVHPYRVSLTYVGAPWLGIDVELSHPETSTELNLTRHINHDLVLFSERLGFQEFTVAPLVELEYQMAQKIHAVTDPSYQRTHDLVDLQLLWLENPNIPKLQDHCHHTFRWRKQQAWPPLPLRSMSGWDTAYQVAREETVVSGSTPVLPDLSQAREWLESAIHTIAKGK